MNIVLFVMIVGVLALACIVWSIRGRNSDTRNPNGLASQLQPIDICAFRNLIDDGEREYLRNHLFPPDFRAPFGTQAFSSSSERPAGMPPIQPWLRPQPAW